MFGIRAHTVNPNIYAEFCICEHTHLLPPHILKVIWLLFAWCNCGDTLKMLTHSKFCFQVGVCVIDVVEGTAMEALASMQGFLRSRPTKFKSLDNAIEWCVRSGQVNTADT